MVLKRSELPKGMSLPDVAEMKVPEPLTLRDDNYIAAIYQALEMLPIGIRIDRCVVQEAYEMPPEVKLILRILGERGEVK